jgi:hypothetical protein
MPLNASIYARISAEIRPVKTKRFRGFTYDTPRQDEIEPIRSSGGE